MGWVRLIAGLAITFAPIAILLVRNRALRGAEFALYAAGGVAASLGVSSLVFFALRFILVALAGLASRTPALRPSPRPFEFPPDTTRLARLAFIIAASVGVLIWSLIFVRLPHGGWDAWGIWNLRARFLFLAESDWRLAFSTIVDWSHPDYPLLLPGASARLWAYCGHATVLVPGLVSFVFTFASVVIVVAAVAMLVGTSAGLVAGLILVGCLDFVHQGAWQYADTVLAAFAALTMAFISLADRSERRIHLLLAGLAAGLAAWTKNEGVLMLVVFVATRFSVHLRRSRRAAMDLVAFLVGAVPALLALASFKLRLAPRNDLIAGLGLDAIIGRLTFQRATIVVRSLAYEILHLGGGSVLVALLTIAIWKVRGRVEGQVGWRTGWIVIVLTGYALVFVATPYDLAWHLARATSRLLIQIWPSFLIALFADGLSDSRKPSRSLT